MILECIESSILAIYIYIYIHDSFRELLQFLNDSVM